MSEMADVLAAHPDWWWGRTEGKAHCDKCDWSEACDPRTADHAFRAHQAAALSAAGFGPVREALGLQQIADVIMTRVVYSGNEGWVLTSEDRDDHEYVHCLDAAKAVIDGRTRHDDQ